MRLGVAVVGAGYWGPNLVRNFMASPDWDLRWVCDLSQERAAKVVGRYSTVGVTTDLGQVLDDPSVQAVAVATPAGTHFEVTSAVLDSGRHALVEKPLAATAAEAEKLVDLAEDRGVVLMCDHTYCYTPAVTKIRELVLSGELGEVQYVDSVRINLGIVQPDIDVIWDLAPHDLSILDSVLPEGRRPIAVSAFGADPVGAGRPCVAYLTLPLEGGAIAHAHVNWLSPTKIRQMIIGGSRRMLVWDDLSTTQRLSLFDKGVELVAGMSPEARVETLVSYRLGEMVAPALTEREALAGVVGELAGAIRERRSPLTDGRSGLRVIRSLDAASRSLALAGTPVPLAAAWDHSTHRPSFQHQ